MTFNPNSSAPTYGGVPLDFPIAGAQGWIDANITLRDVIEFPNVTWPQTWLDRPPKLGRLHWPVGASCWAVAHYLVTDAQLGPIRKQAYDANAPGKFRSLPLVLDDGNGRPVTTSLFMLPPRPLQQIEPGRDLYLLTLVDARYFWRGAAVQITVTGGTTTWAQVFAAISTALGTPITTDTISAAYLKPAEALTSRFGSVPELLDRVCDSIGHRLVRNLDGTIVTQASRTAIASYGKQFGNWPRQAGGKFRLYAADNPNDFPTIPGTVEVVFPRSDSGVPANSTYQIPVTLQSLKLPEYPATVTGNGAAKIIWTTADADFAGGGTPTNQTELAALANQLATDYYLWLLSRLDVVYAGAVPWKPEGCHDVLWDWTAGQLSTRVLPTTRRDADPNPFGAPSNVANYYSTYGSGPLIIENSFYFNQQVTVNNTLFFPPVSNQANTPRGQMSLPTCTVTGPPTWIPRPGYYPIVWSNVDNLLWVWNGTVWVPIPTPTSSPASPKGWEWYRHQAKAPFDAYGLKNYHVVGVHADMLDTVNTTDTASANRIYAGPMIFPGGGTIGRISIGLGGDVAGKCVFGIWKSTGNGNNWPTTKLYNSAEVDLSADANKLHYIDGVNFTPARDQLYWFGVLFDTNTLTTMVAPTVGAGIVDLWGFLSKESAPFSGAVPDWFRSPFGQWIRSDFTYSATLPTPFAAFDNGATTTLYGADGASNWMPAIGLHYNDP